MRLFRVLSSPGPAAVLARTRLAFRIAGDEVKRFIVVDDDRICGEKVEKDDTEVAAKAAIITVIRFVMVLDEVIGILLDVTARFVDSSL